MHGGDRPAAGRTPAARRPVRRGSSASVHQALLGQPRPAAVRRRTWTRPSSSSRSASTLQAVLDAEETPLTLGRPRPDRPGDLPTTSSATARSSRFLRDADVTEIMVNGPDQIYVERAGQIYAGRRARSPTRRTCAAPSTRSSAGSAAASTSRSPMVDARLPDGSRVNAVIPPLALDGSLLTIRKFSADPFTDRRPDRVRHAHRARSRDFLAACVRGRLNILDLRRHRHRQDDDAQRAVRRSSPTTSASSPSRTPPSSSCTRSTCCGSSRARRTSRARARSRIRDLVRNCAAHAPRPHRRRRGPRRRGARHAAGHEHRPRRLDHHGARQHARATRSPASRRWC